MYRVLNEEKEDNWLLLNVLGKQISLKGKKRIYPRKRGHMVALPYGHDITHSVDRALLSK